MTVIYYATARSNETCDHPCRIYRFIFIWRSHTGSYTYTEFLADISPLLDCRKTEEIVYFSSTMKKCVNYYYPNNNPWIVCQK